MSTTLSERVVQQAQLLAGLLATVAADQVLGGTSVRIAELLFQGFDELHTAVQQPAQATAIERVDARQRTYPHLVARIRDKVVRAVPEGSVVAVVTRGDNALVQLDGRVGWHLPQNLLGVWAGYHPANGAEALEELRQLQRKGARYLAIPATTRWWLDFYRELGDDLEQSADVLLDDADLVLYRLGSGPAAPWTASTSRYHAQVAAFIDFVQVLLPASSMLLVVTRGDDAWLRTAKLRARHFPSSVDGTYLGHPADDTGAIAALQSGRDAGATYFAIPAPMAWWDDVYPTFGRLLRQRHRCIADHPEIGALFELTPGDR